MKVLSRNWRRGRILDTICEKRVYFFLLWRNLGRQMRMVHHGARGSSREHVMPVVLTYLVKVEREVAGDGAIETRLEERRPPVTETVRSTPVVFTDSRHARVNGLRTRELSKSPRGKRKTGKNFISPPPAPFVPKKLCHGEKGTGERGNPVSVFTRFQAA